MANDYAWFYNSENGDRKYDADSFSDWLRKFFTTGVFNGDLELSSNNDMSVSLSTGYANIGGKVRMFESVQNFTLDTADAQYDRIDTIVIERNDTDRDITAKLIKGQLSTNPEPTAPVRSGNIYQLVVAEIYVSAGAVRITDEQISDKRMDASVCGYVTGAVEQIDFDMAMQQFSAWFERVKGQLSEDAAGHLQNQIDDINDEIGDTDISEIGDGTVTGAISSLKNTLSGNLIICMNTKEERRIDGNTRTLIYPTEPTLEGYKVLALVNASPATQRDIVVQGIEFDDTNAWLVRIYSSYNSTDVNISFSWLMIKE